MRLQLTIVCARWPAVLPACADFKVEFVEPHMQAGDEELVLPQARLRRHAGSVITENAGELVFSFDNSFSWMNNKAIRLCLGQWPALHPPAPQVDAPPVGGAGSDSGAVSMLRSLRQTGGPGTGGDGGEDDETAPLAI